MPTDEQRRLIVVVLGAVGGPLLAADLLPVGCTRPVLNWGAGSRIRPVGSAGSAGIPPPPENTPAARSSAPSPATYPLGSANPTGDPGYGGSWCAGSGPSSAAVSGGLRDSDSALGCVRPPLLRRGRVLTLAGRYAGVVVDAKKAIPLLILTHYHLVSEVDRVGTDVLPLDDEGAHEGRSYGQ